MSRLIKAYLTVEVELVVSDDMMDEQAIDEFYANTACTFEETENVGIQEVEVLDISLDNPYGDEDIDDEFYYSYEHQKNIDNERNEEFLKNLDKHKALELDEKEPFNQEELGLLSFSALDAVMSKRFLT